MSENEERPETISEREDRWRSQLKSSSLQAWKALQAHDGLGRKILAGKVIKMAAEIMERALAKQDSDWFRVTQRDIAFSFEDTQRKYGPRCLDLVKLGIMFENGLKRHWDPVEKVWSTIEMIAYSFTGEGPKSLPKAPKLMELSHVQALSRFIRLATNDIINPCREFLRQTHYTAEELHAALEGMVQQLDYHVYYAKNRQPYPRPEKRKPGDASP